MNLLVCKFPKLVFFYRVQKALSAGYFIEKNKFKMVRQKKSKKQLRKKENGGFDFYFFFIKKIMDKEEEEIIANPFYCLNT
jgi:hypothetical protein